MIEYKTENSLLSLPLLTNLHQKAAHYQHQKAALWGRSQLAAQARTKGLWHMDF